MMLFIERWMRLARLRALQIVLHDAELTGNKHVAQRVAPKEALMRAELEHL